MKEELEKLAEQVIAGGIDKLKAEREKLMAEAIAILDGQEKKKIWSGYDHLPEGSAPERVIPGCLVLEGGSFRGVYTSGVLDVLMENGINLQTTIGTSAGALNGYNYVAGEIGRSARINLGYRHDRRYFSPKTALKNHGVVGFSFLLDEIEEEIPFDQERFDREDRRFLVTVTDCENGEVRYCEKGITADIRQAVRASASMPYVSEMVDVDGIPCLDGGCAVKIPYRWAMENGYEKILVIRTRPEYFRSEPDGKRMKELTERLYRNYPELVKCLLTQKEQYDTACDELEELQRQGRILMICPSGSIGTSTLEGDMERLGALYLLGRRDAEVMLPEIRKYLEIEVEQCSDSKDYVIRRERT